jgi:hypothetical protein
MFWRVVNGLAAKNLRAWKWLSVLYFLSGET